MQSTVQAPRPIAHPLQGKRLLLSGGITVISLITIVTLHELAHLAVGLLLGLPVRFVSPVSVAVPPAVVGQVAGWRLALMNGIAPLTTMLLGGIAALLLTRLGRNWPDLLNRFVGWWALFGVAYIGFELMGTGDPSVYAGTGSDPAAVAGFLGLSDPIRGLVSFVALLFFLISGFLVVPALVAIEHLPPGPLAGLWSLNFVPSRWRRIAALILIAAILVLDISGAIRIAQGDHDGFKATELLGPLLWAIALALLTAWRTPFAHVMRNQWLFPLFIGWVVLILGGILTNASDYLVIGLYLLGPVLSLALSRVDAATSGIQNK